MPRPTLFYDCWHISGEKSACLWLLTSRICRNWWNPLKVIIKGLPLWPRNHASVFKMEITCFAATRNITPRAQRNRNDCFLPLWGRYLPIITHQRMELLSNLSIYKCWDISALHCVAFGIQVSAHPRLNTFKGYQRKYSNTHLRREWAFSHLFYFLGVGWDWVHLVPRPLIGSRWNEDCQGKPKYSEKTCTSAILSSTNSTWPDRGSNPDRRCGKPATNRLSYGTA
jgi:hypothetical protein